MKSYMMMRVALAAIFFGSTLSATRVRGAECVARVPLHGNTLCVCVVPVNRPHDHAPMKTLLMAKLMLCL